MPQTRRLPYSNTVPIVPVAGVRFAGKSRVCNFDECCSKDGTVTIGRTNERSIRIRDDDTVSRLHCVIYKNAMGRYEMVDARSMNGVRMSDTAPYVRYRTVSKVALEVGLRVKLGGTRLVIVGPDGEPVIAASRFSQIGKVALSLFGSIRAAAGRIRLDHRKFKKIAQVDDEASDNEEDGGDE